MKKIILILLIVTTLIVSVVVLSKRTPNQRVLDEKMLVLASFYPVYFFASEIGGEHANVLNITPAGAEPHDYELSARDIANIERSSILILNGDDIESWASSIKENISSKTIVVEAAYGLTNKILNEGGESVLDPHVWLSPELAEKMTDAILEGFTKADPENAQVYIANANILKLDLSMLDKEFENGLSQCKKNNIITSHAAFGYLAASYGLSQIAIAGLSPDAEPSIQQLREMVDFAKNNDVKYIFFESLASAKLSEVLAGEVGAKTLVLNPLEGLTKDDIAKGKNYFTEMRNNLNNLQIALECKK